MRLLAILFLVVTQIGCSDFPIKILDVKEEDVELAAVALAGFLEFGHANAKVKVVLNLKEKDLLGFKGEIEGDRYELVSCDQLDLDYFTAHGKYRVKGEEYDSMLIALSAVVEKKGKARVRIETSYGKGQYTAYECSLFWSAEKKSWDVDVEFVGGN